MKKIFIQIAILITLLTCFACSTNTEQNAQNIEEKPTEVLDNTLN